MTAMNLGTKENGKPFTLSTDLTAQSIAILGKKGSGKTTAGAVLMEEMLEAKLLPIAIDPVGVWYGLKSTVNGKSAAYKVVVFGGDHADLPLEERSGEVIAQAIVTQRFPAILDLSHLRKGQKTRFLVDFLETLFRLNRDSIHLFCDECDLYCPQHTFGDEARVLGAMEDIVRRGRSKGIGSTLISQRPQEVHKSVLTQTSVLIAMRLSHPKDLEALEAWVSVHADEAAADKMIKSLPSLETGEAWFWSPEWGDIFEKITVRRRSTFDSSATPRPGESRVQPKVLAAVEIAQLGASILEFAKQVEDNDPKKIKQKLAKVEQELAALKAQPATVAAPPPPVRIEVPVFSEDDKRDIQTFLTRLDSLCAEVPKMLPVLEEMRNDAKGLLHIAQNKVLVQAQALGRNVVGYLSKSIAAVPHTAGPLRGKSADSAILDEYTPPSTKSNASGLRRIMVALAQQPGLTRPQLALRAQLAQSGTFTNYLSRLRQDGYLEDVDGTMRLTEAGLSALGPYEALPQGPALLEYWAGQVGAGPARMLYALRDHGRMTLQDLGAKSGLAISGTFTNYRSKLNTLGLTRKVGNMLELNEDLL